MERSQVKQVLKQAGLHPSKERGQNFLLDESILQDMAQAAQLSKPDLVVEVGPGLGVLTELLSQQAKSVFAVELDHGLAKYLQSTFVAQHANVALYEGDILASDTYRAFMAWLTSQGANRQHGYKVVANVPYQITSRLLRYFVELSPQPACLVLMVQKEVAQRAAAEPGKMSLLSLMVQAHGRVQIVRTVSAQAFEPQPEVDSAILFCDLAQPHPGYARLVENERKHFWKLARAGFSSRRKQMKNNLANLGASAQEITKAYQAASLPEKVRAQELSLDQWVTLSKALAF